MPVNRPAGDTGEADPALTAVLAAYAAGEAPEHAVLTTVAASRLLVPVVAVLAEANDDGTEKETEMALPTLIGNDGRKAVIAFTGSATVSRWRADARPVPVPAAQPWPAVATERADAVVIDVAGPVPLLIEGARLAALAGGQPPPAPHEDPDVRAQVAAVTSGFTIEPGAAVRRPDRHALRRGPRRCPRRRRGHRRPPGTAPAPGYRLPPILTVSPRSARLSWPPRRDSRACPGCRAVVPAPAPHRRVAFRQAGPPIAVSA